MVREYNSGFLSNPEIFEDGISRNRDGVSINRQKRAIPIGDSVFKMHIPVCLISLRLRAVQCSPGPMKEHFLQKQDRHAFGQM
jgi:hypothetical protein